GDHRSPRGMASVLADGQDSIPAPSPRSKVQRRARERLGTCDWCGQRVSPGAAVLRAPVWLMLSRRTGRPGTRSARAARRWARRRRAEDRAMESRAKLVGHAIHPMLIVFPLGLLGTAVLFDLVYLLTGNAVLAQ